MAHNNVDIYQLQELEVPDKWAQLQLERLKYLYLLMAILVLTLAVGTGAVLVEQAVDHSESVKLFIEVEAKTLVGYYNLDEAEISTLDEALQKYPQFKEVYTHLDERQAKGELTEFQKKVVFHALNRELWRYFREPMEFYLAYSILKNGVAYPEGLLQQTFPSIHVGDVSVGLSLGMTDLRANRINSKVYERLPQWLQDKLIFDQEAGHVDPNSLADAVNTTTVTPLESALVAVDIYGATIQVYEEELNQAAEFGLWSEDQKLYVGTMLTCCSLSEDVNEVGGFAFNLIADPFMMRWHWDHEVPQTIKDLIRYQKWPTFEGPESEKVPHMDLYSIIRDAFVPTSN